MGAAILYNKTILIISPQAWGKMLLAKHHYALELARGGNRVYFLNPPDEKNWSWNKKERRISTIPVSGESNLFIIHQRLFFPFNFKFHARKIFDVLIKRQINQLLTVIPGTIDIIWSFDIGNLVPLSSFNDKYLKVFHPVDEPNDRHAIFAARSADIIFSVTQEILEKYRAFGIASYFINHGISEEFARNLDWRKSGNSIVQVGFSGNMLRPDLDRKILLQIIKENPEINFNFYGSYELSQSNIGATKDTATDEFIRNLQSYPNVFLRGVLKTNELAGALNQMDVLLICYDILLDQSRGTNYHKVMEYLSTGKVVVSNNITTYKDRPDWIRMTSSRDNNKMLPALFKDTVMNLHAWNSEELMLQRRKFALENTYRSQLEKIDARISENVKK